MAVNLKKAKIDIYIYSDESNRGSSKYSVSKELIDGDSKITFEISELVKDYIDVTYDGDVAFSTTSVFVDVEITRTFIDTGTNEESTDTTGDLVKKFIALRGYGDFHDGVNPELSKDLLMTNRNIFVYEGRDSTIPIFSSDASKVEYYEGETLSETLFSKGATNPVLITQNDPKIDTDKDPYRISLTHIKGEDVSRATSGVSANGDTTKIIVTKKDGTTEELNIFTVDECKHTPYKVTFVNKFGALQDLWFFKKRTDSFDTQKESFKKSILETGSSATTYNQYKHSTRFLDIRGSESLVMNTGFVTEDHNEVIKELLVTEYCWLEDDTEIVPVSPKSSSFVEKTSVNDKLINFEVEFETSNNFIQDIR